MGALLVLVAGAGLWWAFRGGDDSDCSRLGADNRVKAVLGEGWRSDLSCGEVGEGLRAAVVGSQPGVHTVAQAEAMRTVVVVLGERTAIHPALRAPLAAALADYAADTHEVLAAIGNPYAGSAAPGPVREDAGTVRMSVAPDVLVRFLRGLAEAPDAWGVLYRAEIGRVDQQFADLAADSTQSERGKQLNRAGSALGALSAVRTDVLLHLPGGERARADWAAKVLQRVVGTPGDRIPGIGEEVQHLVDLWADSFAQKEKSRNSFTSKAVMSDEREGVDYQLVAVSGIWATERGIDPDSNAFNVLQDDALNRLNTALASTRSHLGGGDA
ncbi:MULTISPECIES: hypothetical protein [Kitasatospora]|uniref:Uncharacterized protein n=1 Tax=Kitasatospora setae (strain ATCC 33774 / DSM 43861 / JCM 3304 / KCC A-0304 / NBRC 14216 / KM-6054) TaxID=452652 RepID=E4NCX5_KITSK|nr:MULTISPECIES: hypothetical protein [Kitasatospora]BAJ29056.1 hypothetical protein KSE_32470 [Kitasatospora setae KM-6054]